MTSGNVSQVVFPQLTLNKYTEHLKKFLSKTYILFWVFLAFYFKLILRCEQKYLQNQTNFISNALYIFKLNTLSD